MDDEIRAAVKMGLAALRQIATEMRMQRERTEAQEQVRATFQAEQRAALERLRPGR